MGLFGPRPPAEHYTQQGLSREIGDNFSYRRATDYEKEVNSKLPGSWDKGFVPSRREITKRIVDRHANIGGQLVAAPATLGGIGAGYFIGGALGGKRYGHIGRMAGSIVGGLASGMVGAGVGHKLGTRRGKRIAKEIPTEPGNVSDFKSKHPILSRVYFAKRKDLKQHRAIPYNQDYRAKDITVYNDSYGPSVSVGASYPIRKQASIKTGLAKQGYYREDTEMTREELIEQIVEASVMDTLYLPKNEKEMKKLSSRGLAGHLGHGWLRGVAASPFLPPAGPILNIARYVKKVGYANRGLHRENATMKKGSWSTKVVPKRKETDGPDYDS